MKTIKDAVSVYQELSVNDRTAFYLTLSGLVDSDKDSMQEILIETRFRQGVYCPHCGTSHIVKNGKRKDGTQRYLCRECGRSFLASTNSIVSGTRKSPEIWKKYLHCMMEQKTLKSTAEDCGISIATAFFWRHKILDALNKTSEKVYLTGTVEADETYLPISYKGNHSKSSHFTMPRPAHKRGRDIRTSSLSSDQACILCAVDHDGISISGIGKTEKVSSDCAEKLFTGRFAPDITLYTEHERESGHSSNNGELQLIRMDKNQATTGIYGIQRMNAYFSKLKGFLSSCHGVSTKYLQNYLTWHNLMFCTLRKRKEQEKILWMAALAEKVTTKCKEMSRRDPIPVLQST